uniref:KIB1-4 beta-propeller domain-containing protein n=1 Tax=Quercus lobata TaxID=97700 RepID=A0A7N2LTB8_QUELO
MLAEKEGSDLRGFFSLSKGMTHQVLLPQANGKKCFSSQGWLITAGTDLSLNLLHPFTQLQKGLLRRSNLFHEYLCEPNGFSFDNFFSKFALSASPFQTLDYVVMAIVFTCDIGGPNPTLACHHVTTLPKELVEACGFCLEQLYLVESSSSLLLVSQGVCVWPVREGIDKWTWTYDNLFPKDSNSKTPRIDNWNYGTMGFKVFEVDLGGGKWKELKSLSIEHSSWEIILPYLLRHLISRDVELIAFTLLVVILVHIGQFLVVEAGIWASTTS